MTDYLILHKVRGAPAFDVAERCDDMGTESDPGPWWIIPTSGHRAYPYWTQPLSVEVPPMPDDWPDHYQTSESPRRAKAEPMSRQEAEDLLSQMGFKMKPSTFERRI
jgi:hypothetical protein